MKQSPDTPATNGIGSNWDSPQSSPLALPGPPPSIPLVDGGRIADTHNVAGPAATTERLAYSVQEAADMLGVNYFSVYRLIQRGKLRVCRALRGKLLVPRTELLKLLKTE